MHPRDFHPHIDFETFEQILEMDDDENEREFSRSIVFDYIHQVRDLFKGIDDAIRKRDLHELSSFGHFLKGSSATIGAHLVRDSCEAIERYGKEENLDGTPEKDTDLCLRRIQERFEQLKVEYENVKKVLENFYDQDNKAIEEDDNDN